MLMSSMTLLPFQSRGGISALRRVRAAGKWLLVVFIAKNLHIFTPTGIFTQKLLGDRCEASAAPSLKAYCASWYSPIGKCMATAAYSTLQHEHAMTSRLFQQTVRTTLSYLALSAKSVLFTGGSR